jgi:fimbrial chaperone protein
MYPMRPWEKCGQALYRSLAVLCAHMCVAHAGSFTVNPVRLTLTPAQPVAAVTVKNVGSEPTVVQLETSSWAQHDGQDALASTAEVLATPPIITIPAGASRIIRVGLRRPFDPQRELTYRLFLREIPPPEPIAQGLRVALLLSMPVFVVPDRLPKAQIQWHAWRTHEGGIRVQARNAGRSHVQLGVLDVAAASNGLTLSTRNVAEYVLPDNAREWILTTKSTPPAGSRLTISSQADVGKLQESVTLEDEPRELNPTMPRTAAR